MMQNEAELRKTWHRQEIELHLKQMWFEEIEETHCSRAVEGALTELKLMNRSSIGGFHTDEADDLFSEKRFSWAQILVFSTLVDKFCLKSLRGW